MHPLPGVLGVCFWKTFKFSFITCIYLCVHIKTHALQPMHGGQRKPMHGGQRKPWRSWGPMSSAQVVSFSWWQVSLQSLMNL